MILSEVITAATRVRGRPRGNCGDRVFHIIITLTGDQVWLVGAGPMEGTRVSSLPASMRERGLRVINHQNF